VPRQQRGQRRPKEDLTGKLVDALKTLISEGVLAPGARLPAERDLAVNFGVARSSLRQALKVLEIMGVVSQRVGDGTYLNSGAATILSEPMEFLILLDGISASELMEARLIVEPELAARAAQRAVTEDFPALRREIEHMEASRDDRERFIGHDAAFHQAVFNVAGNRVCSLMFTALQDLLFRLMGITSQLVAPDHTLELHKRIYTAIRKGDPDLARRRMIEHLTDAKKLLDAASDADNRNRLRNRIQFLSEGVRTEPRRPAPSE
jgi:GntR family transcriptional repressor for pyruvate dehydrogenase complex